MAEAPGPFLTSQRAGFKIGSFLANAACKVEQADEVKPFLKNQTDINTVTKYREGSFF